jgi:putative membrane protein
MTGLFALLISWLVTTLVFLGLANLPTGFSFDSFKKAAISTAVLGVLNAIIAPLLRLLFAPFNFITFSLFSGIINVIILAVIIGLAAKLVNGFDLKGGWVSALVGAVLVSIVNVLLGNLLLA